MAGKVHVRAHDRKPPKKQSAGAKYNRSEKKAQNKIKKFIGG